MSATGRGGVRRANDFYATPPHVTRAILPFLPRCAALDPACGDGAILRVLKDAWPGLKPRGFDIAPSRRGVAKRDALAPASWGAPRLVITNPPYRHAEAFVRRALAEVKTGGTVAMLLRLPFLASKKRVELHRAFPSDVFVFARRPSFTANGRTDATEYAWFVWKPRRGGRWAILDAPAPHQVSK